MQNAAVRGEQIRAGLNAALANVAGVRAVRGQGLMIGVELDRPCGELVKQALAARLLINVTQDSVIRLVPPLIITAAQADEIVARLAPLVRAFVSAPVAPAAAG
jgi:acetylornithine aminotransferase